MTMDELFAEVTDGSTTGAGYFDKLMKSAYGHINQMFNESRLTGTEKANIYLQALNTTMQTATQFALSAQMQQQQIASMVVDDSLKQARQADELLTAAKQRSLLDEELVKATYEVLTLLPDQHNMNLKQIDAITKDIDIKERSTVVQETELSDKLVTSNKQRILLDEEKETSDAQQLILAKDLAIKTYENTVLQVDQHSATLKEIEAKEQQITGMIVEDTIKQNKFADDLLTSQKQRVLLDEEKESADAQQLILAADELLKLTEVGKTKIEADILAVMSVKDGNLKDQQLAIAILEAQITGQKIVGRRQATIIAE